jgi:hypothetical protein
MFFSSFDVSEIEELCNRREEMLQLGRRVRTDGTRNAFRFPIEPNSFWVRTRGSQLLLLAAIESSCRDDLLGHVISVITHLGEVLSNEFLESTGIGQFVRSNAIEFRRLFDRQQFPSVSFAPLRLIIPESLDSTPLRIASLGRIV